MIHQRQIEAKFYGENSKVFSRRSFFARLVQSTPLLLSRVSSISLLLFFLSFLLAISERYIYLPFSRLFGSLLEISGPLGSRKPQLRTGEVARDLLKNDDLYLLAPPYHRREHTYVLSLSFFFSLLSPWRQYAVLNWLTFNTDSRLHSAACFIINSDNKRRARVSVRRCAAGNINTPGVTFPLLRSAEKPG